MKMKERKERKWTQRKPRCDGASSQEIAGREKTVTIGLTKTHSLALMVSASDWTRREGGQAARNRVSDRNGRTAWTERSDESLRDARAEISFMSNTDVSSELEPHGKKKVNSQKQKMPRAVVRDTESKYTLTGLM